MNERWKMNISPGKAHRINRLVGEMSLETFKLHVQITVRVRIYQTDPGFLSNSDSDQTNFILIFIVFHGKGRQKHSHHDDLSPIHFGQLLEAIRPPRIR